MPRYIDADNAKIYLSKSAGEQLDRVPTADVQEVKHGKWIVRHRHEHYPSGKPYDEDVCPFCGRTDHNGDGLYCGYCGAKMDGDENE